MKDQDVTAQNIKFSIKNITKVVITVAIATFGVGVIWSETIAETTAIKKELDEKFEQSAGTSLEKRVETLEQSYQALGTKIDNGFDRLDRKIDRIPVK